MSVVAKKSLRAASKAVDIGEKKPADEKKGTICAIMDSTGACVKFAETRELAEQFVAQKRFEEALISLYGADAPAKFRAALVMPEDALRKVFGADSVAKINEKGNTIQCEIHTVPADDLSKMVSQLVKS